jgi:hypothetical protein
LKECRRVLRADGTLRVVVPNLQYWAERYLESIARIEQGSIALESHEKAVENLIGQLVHWEHSSTREQRPAIRFIERLVRRGTEKTGELHRWMSDAFTLRHALVEAGFIHIQEHTPISSRLPGWGAFCLDTAEDGSVRKPKSLYLEAEKGS